VKGLTLIILCAMLIARDDWQMDFWRDWWRSRDTVDESIDPVPPTYAEIPPEPVPVEPEIRTR
jgi:hypothetical protein